ncbi:MAG: hypothetical protein R3E72_01240 [Steroidobacteraceae bacterium]
MKLRTVCCGLWLLVAAAPAQPATIADQAALVELGRCRSTLDPIVDIGYARIAKRCPKLSDAIDRASWRDLLPVNWRERSESLSANSLAALESLLRGAQAAAPSRSAPAVAALATALEPLGDVSRAELGPWDRFKRWLGRLFASDDRAETGWIERLSGSVSFPTALARIFTYVGYCALAGFAVWVVINEFLTARLSVPSMRWFGRRVARSDHLQRRWSLAEIDALPLGERPSALLRIIVEHLEHLRGNQQLVSLTTRELLAIGGDHGASIVSPLAVVGDAAEQVRYAAVPPAAAALSQAEAQGRALFALLVKQQAVASR